MGMRNHDLVPLELISKIAKLRYGGAHKFVSNLLRYKLISHDRTTYDGYRLTYAGYDILALKVRKKIVSSLESESAGKLVLCSAHSGVFQRMYATPIKPQSFGYLHTVMNIFANFFIYVPTPYTHATPSKLNCLVYRPS